MSRPTLLLCPGRGSYAAGELGYLSRSAPRAHLAPLEAALDVVDRQRAARGDRPLRELDGAGAFDGDFFRGENASALTFACTAFDVLRLDDALLEVVAVAGNSLGWYSALFASGALGLDETFTLVETMGGMTRARSVGAQILYPLVDEEWHADGERTMAVDDALARVRRAGHRAGWSIRYGGFAVLWVDDAGRDPLLSALPRARMGSRKYPLELPGHAAFHSPLMRDAAAAGLEALAGLGWRAPGVPLIDGRGQQWSPLSTDPHALLRYTLGHQVLETFDFAATIRVALREYAPEVVVLLGPGDTLGAAVAHVIIAERWQGIDSRSAFAVRQQDDPLLISMGRPEQAEAVTLGEA